MSVVSFSQASPAEKRQRIIICAGLLLVTALICAGIWKMGAPSARIQSEIWAWQRGEISTEVLATKLHRFIHADQRARQLWAAEQLVSLGVPGSEPLVISVLTNHLGESRQVAELLLNSGNEQLSDYARGWAERNGHKIEVRRGSSGSKWGR